MLLSAAATEDKEKTEPVVYVLVRSRPYFVRASAGATSSTIPLMQIVMIDCSCTDAGRAARIDGRASRLLRMRERRTALPARRARLARRSISPATRDRGRTLTLIALFGGASAASGASREFAPASSAVLALPQATAFAPAGASGTQIERGTQIELSDARTSSASPRGSSAT